MAAPTPRLFHLVNGNQGPSETPRNENSSSLQASHPLKGTSLLLCLYCGRQGAAPTAARPVRQRGPGWSSPGPQPRSDDRRQIPSLPPHSSPCLSLIPLPSHPACSSQVTASRNRQYSPKSPAKDTEGWTGEKTSPSPHDGHPQPCTTVASGTSSTQASAPPSPALQAHVWPKPCTGSLSPLPRITHSGPPGVGELEM